MENFFVHETAIVDQGATVGVGTKIWHWTHVSGGAKIGKNVSIGQNVFIGNRVLIGDNCKIQNNVSIFEGVELGDKVFCGPSVVFTNVINPRSEFDKKNQFKKTIIKNGVSIGANSTIVCGNEIGEYAMIGASSLVTKDIQPYSLSYGSPAKHLAWVSKFGEKIIFDKSGNSQFCCKKTGEIYEIKDNKIKIIKNK